MDCAFPRTSWHEVEPLSHHSSSSAASWSFPIKSRHNNPPPHLHHSPQGPWLLSHPSQSFAHPATSAENQTQGQKTASSPIAFAVRKDCVRTRARREPIAHWSKASSRRCLAVHWCPQKFRNNGIRKQESLLSNKTVSPSGVLSEQGVSTHCLFSVRGSCPEWATHASLSSNSSGKYQDSSLQQHTNIRIMGNK